MTIGVGNLIVASDYNTIQSAVATVLGTGSGDQGYGQAVSSAQVVANNAITASQMQNLKSDLDKIAFHQNNAASSAPGVSVGGTINASDWSTYSSQSTSLNSTRFNISSAQATETAGVAPTFINWNGTRTHVVTVTFASADDARYFFNAGGEIRIRPSQSGQSSSTTKGGRWNSLFSVNSGGILLRAHSTSAVTTGYTGSVATSTGWYELTGTAQTIFNIIDSGTYSGNDLLITASKTTTVLTLNISFNDDGTYGNIDENVDGTTTSAVLTYRATGSNVAVNNPTVATVSGP